MFTHIVFHFPPRAPRLYTFQGIVGSLAVEFLALLKPLNVSAAWFLYDNLGHIRFGATLSRDAPPCSSYPSFSRWLVYNSPDQKFLSNSSRPVNAKIASTYIQRSTNLLTCFPSLFAGLVMPILLLSLKRWRIVSLIAI